MPPLSALWRISAKLTAIGSTLVELVMVGRWRFVQQIIPGLETLTGHICNQLDTIWNACGWGVKPSGGDRVTDLLVIKRLDDIQTLEEDRAEALESPSRVASSRKGMTARTKHMATQ
ncbi:hypothetical protein [Brevundimonas sp.]|uniref:hypothetical protein n=1 Tax=Brevundimonas sp. TaxID=1871086 RepID=UPI003D0AE3C7